MGNGRGMPKPAASCTTTVMPGMVVKTQLTSAVADKAQQGVMELLLINHPLDCPICDKGGECPLQNQAMSNGRADSRFHDDEADLPQADRDLDATCCSTASAACCASAAPGSPSRSPATRSSTCSNAAPQQQIGTSADVPFQSYFSGNTVQICPVGALTGASYRFRARPVRPAVAPTRSASTARPAARSAATGAAVEGHPPAGRRRPRGQRGVELRQGPLGVPLRDPGRPAARRRWCATSDGELVETNWPEALERAATGLREAVDRGGVGVLPGGRLTEEDAYAYAKFARVALGHQRHRLPRPARLRRGARVPRRARRRRRRRQHVSYATWRSAPAVLLVGFEPEEESPIVFLRLHKSTRRGRTEGLVGGRARVAAAWRKLGGRSCSRRAGRRGAPRCARSTPACSTRCGGDGALILVGERLASSPGALSAAAALAADTGARLAWVPRRAGERRRHRRRRAADPAARRPSGRRRGRAAPRSSRCGASAVPDAARPRRRRDPARRRRRLAGRAGRRRRRSGRHRRPGAAPPRRSSGPASSSASRSGAARSPSTPTSSCRWPRPPRRPAATSPGRAGAVRSTSPSPAPARCPTAGCCTRSPRNSTSICGLPTVEAARDELLGLGTAAPRRVRRRRSQPATARRAGRR